MNVDEILTQHNIALPSTAPGRYYTTCPQCSHLRSAPHRKAKVLGVTINADGAHWGCNHCGWRGPSKPNGPQLRLDAAFPAIYDYVGENDALVFQKIRNQPGTKNRFFCRHPDGKGGWINNLAGIKNKPLYRWPEVLDAMAQGYRIAIAEGESDVNALWKINIPATCNFDGAGKWHQHYSDLFRGCDLIVFCDNDTPGRKHADDICRMSTGVAKSVRLVDLKKYWPEMAEGGDVRDFLAAGHTREQLDAIIAQSKEAQATQNVQVSMAKLQTMTFEPIKYVVPGIIVEGLTLLAGKPKIGKSWLLLHAAIAVAKGGFTLGEIHCPQGDVLYCALEDNLRRLQSRSTKLLGITDPWPARMAVRCELQRLSEGGLDTISNWISGEKNPRMVVIDTLAMVKPKPKKEDANIYDADYESILKLRALANEKNIAVVLVHHLRKAEADDAFDTVSGTLGLTGAPDTVLIIQSDRDGGFTLHGRGRDLTEIEQALAFNKDACTWTILGDASTIRHEGAKEKILSAMRDINGPVTPNQLATVTELRQGTIRVTLHRLAEGGQITKSTYGKYMLPGGI